MRASATTAERNWIVRAVGSGMQPCSAQDCSRSPDSRRRFAVEMGSDRSGWSPRFSWHASRHPNRRGMDRFAQEDLSRIASERARRPGSRLGRGAACDEIDVAISSDEVVLETDGAHLRTRLLVARERVDRVLRPSIHGCGRESELPGAATRPVIEAEFDEPTTYEIVFSVPRAVKVAFDETLDLHRAVSGHETSVVSFIEALAAEAAAGPHPFDVDVCAYAPADPISKLETELAEKLGRWLHLPPRTVAAMQAQQDPATRMTRRLLHRVETLSNRAGKGGARELHWQLQERIELDPDRASHGSDPQRRAGAS